MLTEQQIQEARAKLGISSSGITPSKVAGTNLLNTLRGEQQNRIQNPITPREVFGEMGQDIKQTGQGIKEDINKRLDTVSEIQKSDASGLRKATQVFGQGLGAFQDVLGQGIKGFAKVILAPEQEQQVKEGVSNVAGKIVQTKPVQSIIEGYAKLEQTNPKLARDVDTAVNTLMTVLDVAGVGSASAIKKASTEAIEQGLKTAGKTAVKVAKSPVKLAADVGGGLIGKTERYVNSAVTKALNLTQGDVKNIALSTANEPGLWVAEKNLIRGTVDETQQAIKELGDTSYKQVRDEINKVATTYEKGTASRAEDALKAVQKQVNGIPGLEKIDNEVKGLLSKEVLTLNDVQRAKELLDEVFTLYKATGDVADTTAKEGLANIRKDLKEFIETEVKNNTGADIRQLNNDVATARSLEDAIITRSTRGLTKANIGLYDLGAFGAGSVVGGPAVGLMAVIAKKLIQNPAVGLRFAKWLDKLSDARKLKLKAEFEAGNIPDEVEKILNVTTPEKDIVSRIAQPVIKKTKEFMDNPKMGLSVEDVSKKASNVSGDLTSSIQKAKASGQSFDEWVKGRGEKDYVSEVKPTILKADDRSVFKTAGEARGNAREITNKEIEIAQRDQKIFDTNKNKPTEQLLKEIEESKKFADENNTSYPRSIQIKNDILKTRSQLKAEWDKVKELPASKAKKKK